MHKLDDIPKKDFVNILPKELSVCIDIEIYNEIYLYNIDGG